MKIETIRIYLMLRKLYRHTVPAQTIHNVAKDIARFNQSLKK